MEGILQDNLLGPRVFPKGLTLTIKHLPLYEKKKKWVSVGSVSMNSDLSRGTSRNNSWHRLSTEENMQKRPDLSPTHPSWGLWSWLCFKTDSTYSFFLLSPLSSAMTARAPASQINGVEHRPLQSRLQTFSFWASRREAGSLFNHQRCFP